MDEVDEKTSFIPYPIIHEWNPQEHYEQSR